MSLDVRWPYSNSPSTNQWSPELNNIAMKSMTAGPPGDSLSLHEIPSFRQSKTCDHSTFSVGGRICKISPKMQCFHSFLSLGSTILLALFIRIFHTEMALLLTGLLRKGVGGADLSFFLFKK